jgi:hypothetical protein
MVTMSNPDFKTSRIIPFPRDCIIASRLPQNQLRRLGRLPGAVIGGDLVDDALRKGFDPAYVISRYFGDDVPFAELNFKSFSIFVFRQISVITDLINADLPARGYLPVPNESQPRRCFYAIVDAINIDGHIF